MWYFNGYGSATEQQQVVDDYAKNTALMAALLKSSEQKSSPDGSAHQCVHELSQGREPWRAVAPDTEWIAHDPTFWEPLCASSRKAHV